MATAMMPAVRPRELSAREKVATILMTMGHNAAGEVMKHMDPQDLRAITHVMAELKPVPLPQIDELVDAFVKDFGGGTSITGDAATVQKLLAGVLPDDQIADIVAEMEGRVNQTIWDKLSRVPDGSLAAYLSNEHPQTMALVISKLAPGTSARILQELPKPQRDAVARRMLTCKAVVEDALKLIEVTLHEDFMVNLAMNAGGDSFGRMAEIINKMEPDQVEQVLGGLEQTQPKSAEILRSLLFTFDDIAKLSPKSLQLLFDATPQDELTLALKGTNEQFRSTVLASLASRARRMVEQDLASGEPATQREVTEARRAITDRALTMSQRGEIDITTGDEGSQLVS